MYLYFQIDSSKRIYKSNVKSKAEIRENKKIIAAQDYDIYNYSYITADAKTERIYKLLSSIDKNNYCIGGSSIFKKLKILSYKSLEKIKGLISYEWNSKTFAYNRVYIVKKNAQNQFKIVQVQLYFPLDSNGFLSRPTGSEEIIEIP